MEVKPGHKQTEVGVIPEDWDSERLDALGDGKRPPIKAGPFGSSLTKDQYVPAGFKVYGQEQVIAGDVSYGDYFISSNKYRELESCAVQPGDLLLSLVGTIGRLLEIPDGALPGVINPRLLRVSLDRERALPRFLKFLFESGTTQSRLERQAQGGTMGVLNAGVLRPFQVALPPLPEQRAIAAALSDVDALLGGLERLIAKKRDLKQAAMQQLLTGQTRLPGFSGAWEVASLDMLTSRATGVWGSNVQDERNSRRAEIIRAGDISQDGRLTATATRYVSPEEFEKAKCGLDDLVITTSGNGLGKLWWCDGRSDIAASNFVRVLHLVPAKAVGRFLVYALRTDDGMRQLKEHTATSAYPNLRPTYFSTSWIPLPHPAEQAAIAAVLSDMDAELAALEARRDKTRDLKRAMMQELLTGRTRLVPAEAEHA